MDNLYFNRNTRAELALAKAWGGNPAEQASISLNGRVADNRHSRDTPRHSREGGNPSLLAITAATRMQTYIFASLDTEMEKVYG